MADQKPIPDQAFDALMVATLEAITVLRQATTDKNAEGEPLAGSDLPDGAQIDAAKFVIEHADRLLPVLGASRTRRGSERRRTRELEGNVEHGRRPGRAGQA